MLAMNRTIELYSRGQPVLAKDVDKTAFVVHQSGGTIGNYTTSWDFIENDGDGPRKGWRQRNFAEFMRYIKEIFRLDSILEQSFDWKSVGSGTVVDVSTLKTMPRV